MKKLFILLFILINSLVVASTVYFEIVQPKQISKYYTDADGSKIGWISLEPTFSDWFLKNETEMTDWIPLIDEQIDDFEQTKEIESVYERTVQEREKRADSDDIVIIDAYQEDKTETTYLNRFINVDFITNNTLVTCDDWTPPADNYFNDETFTQTRTCTETENRTWIYENNDNNEILNERPDTITTISTEEKVINGNTVRWIAADPVISEWTLLTETDLTLWLPEIYQQTENFEQNKDIELVYERTVDEREQRTDTNEYRITNTYTETDTQTDTLNRLVTVAYTIDDITTTCEAWTPSADTYFNDETFTQTRNCVESETGFWSYTHDETLLIDRMVINDTDTIEEQVVSGNNVRWVEATPIISEWTLVSQTDTSTWTPAIATQTSNFQQSKGLELVYERTIEEREQRTDTNEYRIINTYQETDTQADTDTRTVAVNYTETDTTTFCEGWTPSADNYFNDETFTQTRNCVVSETGTWSYSTNGTALSNRVTVVDTNTIEEQIVSGNNVRWVSATPLVSSWTLASQTDTSTWSPVIYQQTADFQQTKGVELVYERTVQEREQRTDTNEYRITNTYQETDTQPDTLSRLINVDYTLDDITTTCGTWSPSADNYFNDETFTQTRDCVVSETGFWSYKHDSTLLNDRMVINDTDTVQNRVISGNNVRWVSATPLVSNWTLASQTDTSNWSPAISTQTSNFQQSKGTELVYERTIQEREQRTDTNEYRITNTYTENQTDNETVNRTIDVTYVYSGVVENCTTWTPSADNYFNDETFTQSRSCTETEYGDWVYKTGTTTLAERAVTSDTVTPESRTISGTAVRWVSATPLVSDWTLTGQTDTSNWSPAITNQTSNFQQTKGIQLTYERTVQEREQRTDTNEYRIINTYTENQTQNDTESRLIDVAYSVDSTNTTCTEWTPSSDNANNYYTDESFSQSRTCETIENGTWSYETNNIELSNRIVTSTTNTTENRQLGGTLERVAYSGDTCNDGVLDSSTTTALNNWHPTNNYTSTQWCNLNSLVMYSRGLTTVPNEIGALTNLSQIQFQDNSISSLPDSIGNLRNLRELYVQFNNLQQLPDTITSLSNLITLSAYANNISYIPNNIGDLNNIQTLLLNGNNLSTVPDSINNIGHLNRLELQGNPGTPFNNITCYNVNICRRY